MKLTGARAGGGLSFGGGVDDGGAGDGGASGGGAGEVGLIIEEIEANRNVNRSRI